MAGSSKALMDFIAGLLQSAAPAIDAVSGWQVVREKADLVGHSRVLVSIDEIDYEPSSRATDSRTVTVLVIGQAVSGDQNATLDLIERAIDIPPRTSFMVGDSRYNYMGRGIRVVLDARYRDQFGIDAVVGFLQYMETV